MLMSEDREIVERVRAGDSASFERLVSKYARLGGSIAYGVLGDFELAEDVVQESLLKAYRSLDRLRNPEFFRSWFAGIVKRQALDVFRKRNTRSQATAALDEKLAVSDQALGPEEHFLREEERQKVLAAMEELGQDDRMVLVLKHMEGLSYREISDITHSSVSAVESRLFRARRLLKRKLGSGGESEGRVSEGGTGFSEGRE
ncbi:MAG: RNA polymerase sigma factor [Planctomycetota bacterium]